MPDRSFEAAILIQLPDVVPPVAYLRGTAIVSSLQVLGEMNMHDRLFRALPKELHEPVRGVLAASWVGMELCVPYYRAVNTLELTEDQIVSIGRRAAERVQSAVVATIIRGLRGIVTPVTILSRMDRLWSRNTQGGAVRVVHQAPREIRLEAHGAPYLDFQYNRTALMGYYHQALTPAARTIQIRELGRLGPGAAAWNVVWT